MPSELEEAVRDLVRVREDLKGDRRMAIQRLKSFLLRHGIKAPKGWHTAHNEWARALRFEQPAAREAFHALLGAVQTRDVQLRSLDASIDAWAAREPLSLAVTRLRTLRGVDTLTAATIASEVSDFRAFASAPAFMGFTGLVPSEHSSGAKTRRGSITKAGNHHLRRRQQDQPQAVLAHSWAAQLRLHDKYVRVAARGDRRVAVVAVARELRFRRSPDVRYPIRGYQCGRSPPHMSVHGPRPEGEDPETNHPT